MERGAEGRGKAHGGDVEVEGREWVAVAEDGHALAEALGEPGDEATQRGLDFEEDVGAALENQWEIAEELEGVAVALLGVDEERAFVKLDCGIAEPKGLGEGPRRIAVFGAIEAPLVLLPAFEIVAVLEEIKCEVPVLFGVGGFEAERFTQEGFGGGVIEQREDLAVGPGEVGRGGVEAMGLAKGSDGVGGSRAGGGRRRRGCCGRQDWRAWRARAWLKCSDGGGEVAFLGENDAQVVERFGVVGLQAERAQEKLDRGDGLAYFLEADAGGVPDFRESVVEREEYAGRGRGLGAARRGRAAFLRRWRGPGCRWGRKRRRVRAVSELRRGGPGSRRAGRGDAERRRWRARGAGRRGGVPWRRAGLRRRAIRGRAGGA